MLIDRNGKWFGKILDFLRDGSIPFPEARENLEELLAEANFYQIQELIDLVDRKLLRIKESVPNPPFAPFVSSPEECEAFIKSSSKPVIVFTLSLDGFYHSVSDKAYDSLVKNFRLFVKLRTLYSSEMLFIINFSGKGVCNWSFHHEGTKFASIDSLAKPYENGNTRTQVIILELE